MIVSSVSIFISISGLLSAIGIVLSIFGLVDCGKKNEKGRGLAIAGIVIGIVKLVIIVLFIAGLIMYAADLGNVSISSINLMDV